MGEGACNLAARLHAEGLKSPRGKLWSKATILHILRNPVYTGTLVWGSRRTGLQVHKVADPVRVEDAWEALVSVEDFQQVQLRIAERSREVIQPNILRSSYLLSGILFCGHCGHPFIGHPAKGGQHHYYGCQRKMKSGAKACTAKLLRQELVEEAVVAELRDAVLNPLYLKALLEQVNEELRQAGAGEGEELESIRGQEAEVRRKLDRLYEALESGTMELDLLAPRLREWKTRLAELEARAAALKGKGQLHYLADEATVRRYLESLHSLLEQGSMAQRRSFLRARAQRIDATGYELRLTCTLPPLPEEAPLRAAAGAEKQAARAGARPKKQEAEPVVNEVLPRGRSGSPGLSTGGTWTMEAHYRPAARVGRVKKKGERRETGPERWARWRRLLEEGVYKSRAELARAEGVTRAAVTQGLKGAGLNLADGLPSSRTG